MNITFEFKNASLGESGEITGYASVFHTIDAARDIVVPGAFEKTLHFWKQKKKWPKMLWNHEVQSPIGTWTKMQETPHGLYVEGKILLDIQRGREVYSLLKSGAIEGLSIGYRVKDSDYDPTTRAKKLKAIDLLEVSFVTFPANTEAQILSVKDNRLASFISEVKQAELTIKKLYRGNLNVTR